jgi:hypothetical protein
LRSRRARTARCHTPGWRIRVLRRWWRKELCLARPHGRRKSGGIPGGGQHAGFFFRRFICESSFSSFFSAAASDRSTGAPLLCKGCLVSLCAFVPPTTFLQVSSCTVRQTTSQGSPAIIIPVFPTLRRPGGRREGKKYERHFRAPRRGNRSEDGGG